MYLYLTMQQLTPTLQSCDIFTEIFSKLYGPEYDCVEKKMLNRKKKKIRAPNESSTQRKYVLCKHC